MANYLCGQKQREVKDLVVAKRIVGAAGEAGEASKLFGLQKTLYLI